MLVRVKWADLVPEEGHSWCPSEMNPLLLDVLDAQTNSFAAVQWVGTAASNRGLPRSTEDALLNSVQLAVDSGIRYVEVWDQGLYNENWIDDWVKVDVAMEAEEGVDLSMDFTSELSR